MKVEGHRTIDVAKTTTDRTQEEVLHTSKTYKVLGDRIDLN